MSLLLALLGVDEVSGSLAGNIASPIASVPGAHGVAGVFAGTISAPAASFSGQFGEIVTPAPSQAGSASVFAGRKRRWRYTPQLVEIDAEAAPQAPVFAAFGALAGGISAPVGRLDAAHGVAGRIAGDLSPPTASMTGRAGFDRVVIDRDFLLAA